MFQPILNRLSPNTAKNVSKVFNSASNDVMLFITGSIIGIIVDTFFIWLNRKVKSIVELEWSLTGLGLSQLWINSLIVHTMKLGLRDTGFLLMGMLTPQTMLINKLFTFPMFKPLGTSSNDKKDDHEDSSSNN